MSLLDNLVHTLLARRLTTKDHLDSTTVGLLMLATEGAKDEQAALLTLWALEQSHQKAMRMAQDGFRTRPASDSPSSFPSSSSTSDASSETRSHGNSDLSSETSTDLGLGLGLLSEEGSCKSGVEGPIARALIAYRAAQRASEEYSSSVEDDCEEEEGDEDEEMYDAEEDEEEEGEVEEEVEDEVEEEVVKPDDTYHRRMRRVSAWRVAAETDEERISGELPRAKILKRKPSTNVGDTIVAKRARLLLAARSIHVCSACCASFSTKYALKRHGSGIRTSEACRTAVAYEFE